MQNFIRKKWWNSASVAITNHRREMLVFLTLLGTLECCVSLKHDAWNILWMPCVFSAYVLYGERQRFMGASAKNAIMSNLKNTCWGWKKLIGRTFSDPQVQKEKSLLPYEVVEGPCGQAAIRVRTPSHDIYITCPYQSEKCTVMVQQYKIIDHKHSHTS